MSGISSPLVEGGSAEPNGSAVYVTSPSQSIPNGTYTVIDFNSQEEDSLQKGVVTTGASWRYTATKRVVLSVHVLMATDGTKVYGVDSGHFIQARVNGAEIAAALVGRYNTKTAGTYRVECVGSASVTLDVGDYFDIRFAFNRTASPDDWTGYIWISES